ncbi:MAG: hypothetical protein Q9164_005955 [Protoblastenia rupestris]
MTQLSAWWTHRDNILNERAISREDAEGPTEVSCAQVKSAQYRKRLIISQSQNHIITMTTETVEILKEKLETLLMTRDYPKTICPSEVPRALTPDELNNMGALTWRDLMPFMREIVWDLREKRDVEVLQKGNVIQGFVQLRNVKGPIRVRRRAM